MNLTLRGGLMITLLAALTAIELVHAQSSVTAPINNATSLPVGSCTPTIACSNGACCNGNSGFCGFGPAYCTPVASGGNCTSNCQAQAECGQYAPPANRTCPLNVCCSQYGFCGTTTEFCSTGCQSNCGDPIVPICGPETNSALTRRIGYYNGGADSRPCMIYPPEDIFTELLTHINFAFASISNTFQLVEANTGDGQLWKRTTNLKSQNPTLKVFLSIGGWTFNDPPTSTIFSQLVGSTANTNTFIASALFVMETYAFDGIDIDWEYPGAYDRGGGPADTENYVAFMAAVKAAFRSPGYGLSFTAPSSYWYLQHFDLLGLLKSADWVNVMTYDLHGVWDGTDPYIGYVLDAHTNLTEIDQAFDLYWRAGVNPSQVNIGFAFYGRTFTLSSPACWAPGCPWASGGNPGMCTNTAGILMFSEIEAALAPTTNAQSVIDPVAAVNYMLWQTNQWVSYDTAETFAMKMNYANDHCLGGSMIWSVDQDDATYTELTGLYGNVTQGIASGVTQGTGCIVTDWNAPGCPAGYSFVGSMTLSVIDEATRLICCEAGTAPSPESCSWQASCDSVCPPNTILLATSTFDCPLQAGASAFCCQTNNPAISNCVLGECSSNPTCPPGNSLLVTEVTAGVSTGCPASGGSGSCSTSCAWGEAKAFCCADDDFPYQNCTWNGTPPLCMDGGCPIGQITLLTDIQGGADQPCTQNARSYCCDPIGSAYVPVPFDDIFASSVTQGAETFDVEFDPDVTTGGADTLSDYTTSDNENTEAFGEVFIDSPNPQSVSSLAVVSNWVVTSCDAKSDQPQTVLAYCSKSMDNSGCAHVFIGGPEHTIVQMPKSCGLGPYARVASLVPHANQSILPAFHQAQKPANELVYSFSFDYDFSVIPESNGPVYMRADVTDMPGYWDSVVDSPPERKRWLKEQESKKPLLRRWWGSFTTWLSKITTVEQSASTSRIFSWTDTWTIYNSQVACPGSATQPSFEASLDISVTGAAAASARYGFYLQATVVPPSVQAAYLFLNTDATTYASFKIQGVALVQYNSDNIQFASFGFPGLYYPGLLTIGPSLVINGYIAGELSIDATLVMNTEVQFPSINIQLGAVGDNFTATPTDGIVSPMGIPIQEFGANVQLAGDLSLHLVPALQLGVNILNGAVVDAQAYVQTDLYTGISLTGSASNTQSPEACYNAYYGVDFTGGLTGSLLYWESSSVSWPFYQTEYTYSQACASFGSTIAKRDISNRGLPMPQDISNISRAPDGSSAYILERIGDQEKYIHPVNQPFTIDRPIPAMENLMRRDTSSAVPTVPGTLLCPGSQGLNQTDGDVYSDLPTLLDAFERKKRSIDDVDDAPLADAYGYNDEEQYDLNEELLSFILDDFNENNILSRRTLNPPDQLARTVTVPGCTLTFAPLAYTNGATNEYWDLDIPQALDGDYVVDGEKSPYAGERTYAREHIYEVQLIAQFIGYLQNVPSVWQGSGLPFCTWVNVEILQQWVLNDLLSCLPNNQSPNTPYMPWLEAWANGVKARAFQPVSIFTQSTFQSYSPSKQVAVMRATSGALSYMMDPEVRESFLYSSRCIRNVWDNFNSAITPQYNNWIFNKVNQLNAGIQTGMANMIQWWNAQAGASTTLVPVVLGYNDYVTLYPNNFNYNVSGQELQNDLGALVQQNGINWANQLYN